MLSSLLRSLRFMRAYSTAAAAAILAVLAASAADLAAPQLLRWIVDAGVSQRDMAVVAKGCVALIGVAIAGALAQFAQGYLSAKASHGAAFDMRNEIFAKLQALSFSYHDRAQTGNLITRVTSDVDLVRDFVGGGLVNIVSAALILIGAIALLVAANWRLAMVAIVVVPATLAVLVSFVGRLGPQSRRFQERLGALNSVLQEDIAGIRVVKAFARESFERERYDRASQALLEQGLAQRRIVANSFPLLSFVGSLGVVAVTWYGAVQIVDGSLTVGGLVAFTAYIALLLQPLFVIGFGAQAVARAGASAQRLFEVLDARSDVEDRPGAPALPRVRGRVEFRDVVLRYPGDEDDTLRGVSFVVEPETSVALVGATGSGKTSIVSLIPRFYDATAGRVLIDGLDVRDVGLDSLRSQVGVVMQEPVLFSGSVRDNIAYGRAEATDDEIVAAATAAQAHEFITQLPDGYGTRIGERGVRLSGGQRQRVAIARALLVDPRILIMDDSASSLDAETEAALRSALRALMAGRTTFVVASRLATVRRADVILLVDDGRIVATGTHDELLARNCLYAGIAASQFSGTGDVTVPPACTIDEAGDAT